MKTEHGKLMYKVERKSANSKAAPYEVLLSPFKTFVDATDYIKKYKEYYPVKDASYKITKLYVA